MIGTIPTLSSPSSENTIPEGYKPSELGPIPEDWIETTFGEVLTGFSSGMTPYRGKPEYYTGKINWITSGELRYNVITDTEEKITQAAVEDTRLKILPKGTFLMAITGLEAAGTRGSCGVVGKEATTNQSCMALFPTDKIITEYLFYFYCRYGNEFAFKYCQGTKQQSYTGRIVKILPIVLPPTLTEQHAIATALSDVDALLRRIGMLIDKKRAIKQGAMQELLTGRRRLEGFGGEWKKKKLGEIGSFRKGKNIPKKNLAKEGEACVLYGEIYTKYHNVEYELSSKIPHEIAVNAEKIRKGDILFASSGETLEEIGKCFAYVGNTEAYAGGDIVIFSPVNCDSIFLGYLLNTEIVNQQKANLGQGSSVMHIYSSNLREISIQLPPKEEQKAIAQILSDMDAEIATLEAKQAKYQAIKQGMMQELLTGKTRLV